jgi:competence protein ComEC
VTAILIGDRAGLDDRIERDLQDAGTYHVIAISGGNIAILAGCLLLTCRVLFIPWRAGLSLTIVVLVAYAELAGGGSSVSRATTMAVVYLGAMLLDQRTSAASALAVGASLILMANPLSLVDPGFLLTFGATIAIVLGVPAFTSAVAAPAMLRPPLALLAASAAAEVALLPLGPLFFSRVTFAGVLFNFAAVPLMSIVQIGGMAAVAITAAVPSLAHAAGWVPHQAARGLVSSAALVHYVPWLTWRVPPPSLLLMAVYYCGLVALVSARVWAGWTVPRHAAARRVAMLLTAAGALLILTSPLPPWFAPAQLRVVVLDVGQGDATFVRFPSGRTLLVDAGGLGGTARFDIGERVVAPALWHFGVRRLDVLAVTHGDADHAGGAGAALDIFRPREVWDGVPVPRDAGLTDLAARADARRIPWRTLQAGDVLRDGAVTVHAWHPPPPDWERQRVRNDDSLVLEIRYGDVSVVLPGDIGREVEEGLARVIPAARIRVLKVPHHGSATSSSMRFLTALRPQLAIVSCGRGNRFNHPSPAVLARYREVGAAVYRTDQQGAITIDTDGRTVNVTPFVSLRQHENTKLKKTEKQNHREKRTPVQPESVQRNQSSGSVHPRMNTSLAPFTSHRHRSSFLRTASGRIRESSYGHKNRKAGDGRRRFRTVDPISRLTDVRRGAHHQPDDWMRHRRAPRGRPRVPGGGLPPRDVHRALNAVAALRNRAAG